MNQYWEAWWVPSSRGIAIGYVPKHRISQRVGGGKVEASGDLLFIECRKNLCVVLHKGDTIGDFLDLL